MDALAYATSTNIIPVDEVNNDSYFFGLRLIADQDTNNNTPAYLTSILSETQIKRACCINNGVIDPGSSYTIPVRIPIPTGLNLSNSNNSQLWNTYKFYDKTINIPASICNKLDGIYQQKSQQCDEFMNVYCNNAKQDYINSLNGAPYDDNFFTTQYKPECGCYGNAPTLKTGISTSFSPCCYSNGCVLGTPGIYFPTSAEKCQSTFCTSIVNITNDQFYGETNINPQISQECSHTNSSTPESSGENPSGGGSSGGGSTGGGSTGGGSSGGGSSGGGTTTTTLTEAEKTKEIEYLLIIGGALCVFFIIIIVIIILIKKK